MDYTIKPEAGNGNIPTSEWPLLLKNYDKRTFPSRSSFILAFPSIQNYILSVAEVGD